MATKKRSAEKMLAGLRKIAKVPKPKRRPPPLKKYNVEFWGRAHVYGVITVSAADEQSARTAAFAEYQEDGVHWRVLEEMEDYPARIHSVDPA